MVTMSSLILDEHRLCTTAAADELPLALVVDGVVKAFAGQSPFFVLRWLRRVAVAKPLVAIDHVSLTVRRGEIFGILGANGSGKSTLIRLVSTLLIPDAGRASVFGLDVEHDADRVKRLINRVSVDAAFFKKLSPMENLMYAARLYGMSGTTARDDAIRILAQLGIGRARLYEPLEKMSRGMQQKVAIARALLTSPVLLLLDEPTTGLDPRSKREVQQFVLNLRASHDATVVLTTHDMEEADRLCDRIAIIDAGRIIAENTPAALKLQVDPTGNATLEDVFMQLTGRSLTDSDALAELLPEELDAATKGA